MNKIVVLTAAAASAAVTPAMAQSAISVSGVADAAVRYVNNEGRDSNWSLVSGGNSTSKLIIRGTEDLGGGLSAGFHLEHGFLINNGAPVQSTQFWDRRSTVSLASKTFGELRGGRDYVPSYLNWNRFDPFAYVGVAGANNLVSNTPQGPIRAAFGTATATTVRTNSAVEWFLPSGWGGLEGQLLATASDNGTTANGVNTVRGGRLGWASGPFVISAARTTTENNLTTDGKFTDDVFAGAYNFGFMRLSVGLRRFEYSSSKQTNLLVGVTAPLGSGELKASINQADFDGSVGATDLSDNGATQYGLGYVYNLSKRTALYGTLSYITNDGAQASTVPGGNSGMAGGGSSKGVEAGLRHNF
ncbi:MAG TPA: porin [Rubrivivax sp.]